MSRSSISAEVEGNRRLVTLEELAALGRELAASGSEVSSRESPMSIRALASVSLFATRESVFAGRFTTDRSIVAAVLEGRKHIERPDGVSLMIEPGDLFIAPAGSCADVANTPDLRSGKYRALVAVLDPEAVSAVLQRYPELPGTPALGPFDTQMMSGLRGESITLQAVLHFARTLLVAAPPAVVRHRLEDLVLALCLQASGNNSVRPANGSDIVHEVRMLIRRDPAAEWDAKTVSRHLASSVATLRRRLAEHGTSLRELRIEERMALAAALLSRPDASVAQVALRVGYRSPSKFARQYRLFTGKAPSGRHQDVAE